MKRFYFVWLMMFPLFVWAGSVSVTDSVSTPVNDNSCFDKTFDVTITSAITDVSMEVNIDHTWRADLDISLTSPSGTIVDLTSDNGGSRNNLYVIFDDAAATSIVGDNTNHNSVVNRQPEQPLSAFDGENPNGTWTLTVCDDAGGDTGTYNYATLTIYNNDPDSPPIVNPVPTQIGTLNRFFSADLSAYVVETDSDSITSYSITGTLPSGLSFDTATGILSGTPTALGNTSLTLFATDKDGTSAGESFTVKIFPEGPKVNYRMDECFWFNSSAVIGDVKDSSPYGFNATSSGAASITSNTLNPPVCNYGTFAAQPDLVSSEDNTAGNTSSGFTVSFWMRASQDFGGYAVIATKSKAYDWNDGWGFVNPNSTAGNTLRFYINAFSGTFIETTVIPSEGWVHIVGTYDQNNLRLYKNGVEVTNIASTAAVTNSSDPIRIGYDDPNDAEFIGDMDEFKFWDYALTATEIQNIYNNELSGLNYDGSSRTCNSCSANISGGSWVLIGVPADLRQESDTSISRIIGDNFNGTYGVDWRVYAREYSDTNNSSWYTYLSDPNTQLSFGTGYWLGSKNTESWNVNDMVEVDYNSTHSACVSTFCVELDVKSVSLNFGAPDNDPDDGTGPYRYNMSGFIGKSPVDWADCRFIVDGVAMTPSEFETNGYGSKQIWQYNPGNSGANANGYTTCDDTTPGGCKLEPYQGFWVELHGLTKNKTVKLLIPKE
ncbi:MAG: proprotein convertase P-domain-containing protein [Sulfurovum sp.]|nr:proprotein convertase P-domain-containing protein [Sulfurovum sp.]